MSETAYGDRRWTRKEYGRLIELGVLGEDDPIELIEGRMIVAEPQNPPHANAIELGAETLRAAFGRGWRIRVQLPVALGPDSEPNPDIAVVRGSPRDAGAEHPATAALIVEIADSSLRYDRVAKARIYARAGVADYWIVNLVDRVVEVHREPRGVGRRLAGYRTTAVAQPGDVLVPLANPDVRLRVDDLLP